MRPNLQEWFFSSGLNGCRLETGELGSQLQWGTCLLQNPPAASLCKVLEDSLLSELGKELGAGTQPGFQK